MKLVRSATLFGAALLVLILCGCRFAMPEEKIEAQIHATEDISASYQQVRIRVRAMVGPMCGEIEQTADEIIAGTTNAAVQHAALLWKIEGVPAMRAALFQPNPFTAFFDSWVLCFQMGDYFDTGPGKTLLGEESPMAVAACQRLEGRLNEVIATITKSGDVSKARRFAQQWARDHPISDSISDRESTLSRVLEKGEGATSLDTREVVAQTATSLDDLNRRIEIYSDQMFRQGRWEADLFKADLLRDLRVNELLSLGENAGTNLDRVTLAAERAVAIAEATPQFVTTERMEVVKAMHEELTRSLQFAREERIEVLNELQRIAAAERKILTDQTAQMSVNVVDHAFYRAAQLIAATLVSSAVGSVVFAAWVLRRLGPRRHPVQTVK